MKTRYALAALALSPITFAALAAPPAAQLIVPGKRIGQLHLGRYPGALPLGKPTADDPGMSQDRIVWVSKTVRPGHAPDTVFIHTISNGVLETSGPGVTVDIIRVTSPFFRTVDGLSTASSFSQIRRRDTHLKKQEPGTDGAGQTVTTYDDIKRGIGFEFLGVPSANSRPLSVFVHTPGSEGNGEAQGVYALLHQP